jgi:hypothetical protein
MKIIYLRILRIIAFLVIFGLLSSNLTKIFMPKELGYQKSFTRAAEFYDLPRDSIDVLFLGASSFYRGIIPLQMWENNGFTGFVRAVGGQTPMISYYYLEETLKYQKPAVLALDAVSLFTELDIVVDEKEGQSRTPIDSMRLSPVKIRLIHDIVSMSEEQTVASYLFPLLRYHSRWDELGRIDFEYNRENTIDSNKGYFGVGLDTIVVDYPKDFMQPTEIVADFSQDSLKYYEKIIQLCQENNIAVVLVTMPRVTIWDYSRHLAVQQLADAKDVQFVDYCLGENLEAIDLDVAVDFRDEHHLNTLGARKVTRHLGDYLQEMYGLVDRRNDPAYQQWSLDLQMFNHELSEALASTK